MEIDSSQGILFGQNNNNAQMKLTVYATTPTIEKTVAVEFTNFF